MTALTLAKALNTGLHAAMAADENVLVMGEDVGQLGGVFRVTDGLQTTFGAQRVMDSPLAESGIIGTAIGLAHAGFRSRPMSRASHSTPNMRVRWSANTASCSSDKATVAACIGRPSNERHLPSRTVCTLFEMTTCVCKCGSPARLS